MIALLWNCRGLGKPSAVQALKDLIRSYKPSLVFLTETKLCERRMLSLKFSLGFNSCFAVDRIGFGGGLALLWNSNLDVSLQSFSVGHIDAYIKCDDADCGWFFTGFYGHPEVDKRKESWKLLERIGQGRTQPWFCGGDFNEILYHHEMFGQGVRAEYQMKNFRDATELVGVADIGCQGAFFTWNNGRKGNLCTCVRLDRGFANLAWKTLFPNAYMRSIPSARSDHLPLLLHLHGLSQTGQTRAQLPRRFEVFWLQDPECARVVEENWRIMGSSVLQGFKQCGERVMSQLRDWSWRKYGNLEKKIKKEKEALANILEEYGVGEQYVAGQRRLEDLLHMNDDYWRIRSRSNWMQQGDRNTSYFHHHASQRRTRNQIKKLKNSTGVWIEDGVELEKLIVGHYTSLFTHDPQVRGKFAANYSGVIRRRLSVSMQQELAKPFTADEVLSALKLMHPTKAPGPDGYQAIFFQKFWGIIGNDVLAVVLGFLNGEEEIAGLNETFISLIPKVKSPEVIADYRPISLCNVVYKLIAKTLALRMKGVMGFLIDEAQSAFVPDRLITDNVIVAFEAFHKLKKGTGANMAVKLDMSKAYDRIEWPFLEWILGEMGFSDRWVWMIMHCVSSVSFRILINGKPSSSFTPSRGIRQGDPLSPYLFILCSEGFSALIREEERKGMWNGVTMGCNGPLVSHLFFADDSLLFCSADVQGVTTLTTILQEYELATG